MDNAPQLRLKDEWLKEEWLKEESIAHIHGWDFSHIGGRYEEEQDRYSMTVSGILRHRFISVGKP